MSYMNSKHTRSPEREQLQLFVNDVKREIDSFWTNILDEFNTFSNDITNQLDKMEKDYSEYRQKYGISVHSQDTRIQITNANTNNTLDPNRHNVDRDGHRSSLEFKEKGSKKEYAEHKEQYKKFARAGNSVSVGHGRTLSTMEIPSAFRLDPIEESILIIKPRAATTHCKDIYTTLLDENFYVTDFEEGRANAQYFEALWAKKYGYVPYYKKLCAEMAVDTFLVLKVFRVNAINELIDLCGNEDPHKAYNDNPNTLRAMFGESVIQNAVYPAKNQQEVDQFNRDFFNNDSNKNDDIDKGPQQQSLVVIKPNAAKQFGDIIRAHFIGQKFEIIQQKVFNLNSFVYSNMTYDAPPEHTQDIVDYMASGAVIALIVQKANVYNELERVVGDRDPESAAQNQPESIRAHYGESIIKNAIEYAKSYDVYKSNIPTFFFDANIMNQVIDMNAIEQIKHDIAFQNNSPGSDDAHEIDLDIQESLEPLDAAKDRGFAIVIIKPHVSSYQIEAIQDVFADHDIAVKKQKSLNMPYESIKEMLRIEYRNNEVIQLMANHLASNEILVWLVASKTNKNIFHILREIVPSIRDQYGIDEIRDVMHFTTTPRNFKAIADEFFFEIAGPTPPKTPNINLKLKSLDQMNKPMTNGNNQEEDIKHQRRGTEVKPFISQFAKEQRSIILIKAHITKNQLFQIRKMLHDASIEVVQEKQMTLPIDILHSAFEMDGYEDDEYHSMCQYIASHEFIVWMVQRENVYEQLRYVVGPENPIDAKSTYPQSIRAYYGLDKIRNAVYFSPNEHIYNHQVGIFFFHDENENDGTEIPNVPSERPVPRSIAAQDEKPIFDAPDENKFNYISDQLMQIHHTQSNQIQLDDLMDVAAVGDDEYALILLSSAVTANAMILDQLKSRITAHKFVIVDQLSSFFPQSVVSDMFNDGHSSFSSDGPPIPKAELNELMMSFNSGEIMALHVCRQSAYLLLDALRKELEQHNLITSIYITLSVSDYNSKCAHFFDSGQSDDDKNENENVFIATNQNVAKSSQSTHSQLSRRTVESMDNNERAIIIFKPHITDQQKTDIRRMLLDEMLHVFDETSTYIPRKTLRDLLSHEGYDEYYMDQLCQHMAGNSLEAWLVKGENIYKDLTLIVGPEDSDVARIQAPNSIRAIYGVDKIQNVLYFTKTKQVFEETHRYFFFDEPISQHEQSDKVSNEDASGSGSFVGSGRQNKPLMQQLEEFEKKSNALSSLAPPLNESDEEQRAVLILQHYLKSDQIDSIRIILENKDIEVIQEKEAYLPTDTYRTIFELSQPNWSSREIEKACEYFNKGECTAFLVGKPNIYVLLDRIVGNENPLLAANGSIRQLFGIDELQNACFFTRNERSYQAIVDELFFDRQTKTAARSQISDLETSVKKQNMNRFQSYQTLGSNASVDQSWRSNEQQKSILVFKPHMKTDQIEKVEAMIYASGLTIINQKTTYLPADVWHSCMKEEVTDQAHLRAEAQHLSSGSIAAYLVVGDDAYDKLSDLAGPTEPNVAKLHMPQSIRALYGIDEIRNCVWWSKNRKTYKRIFNKFFFSEHATNSQANSQSNARSNNHDLYTHSQRSQTAEMDPSAKSMKYTTSKYRPANTETASASSSIRGEHKTLIIIKPHVSQADRDKIKHMLRNRGIHIIQEKETHLARESCRYLLKAEGYDENYSNILVDELNKGELCAMLVSKEGIFQVLKDIVGPTDPAVARKTAPSSIRANYGKDIVRNAIYYTKSKRHYKKVFSFFFFEDRSEKKLQEVNEPNTGSNYDYTQSQRSHTAEMDPSAKSSYNKYAASKYRPETASASSSIRGERKTLIIIKPHVSQADRDRIKDMLRDNGIYIIQEKDTHLAKESCRYLLKAEGYDEDYSNILVDELNKGELCAMLVSKEGIFQVLKEIVGPTDPAVARTTAPSSIRAIFGKDIVRNAIYYTKSKRHYKKVFSFFFFEDKSEKKSNEAYTHANDSNHGSNYDYTHSQRSYTADVYPSPKSSHNKYTSSKYRPAHTETASASSSIRAEHKTLIIIKPHVSQAHRDKIKRMLRNSGIYIIQEKATHLAKESCQYLIKAEGYDEDYSNILVNELNKGELCAMLVSKEGIFQVLKEIVGPTDPAVARKTAPSSIRALYGKDIVRNAIYYTKSKRHYKKVFSFFFFEDVSEKKLEEVNEADNSNSALLTMDDEPYNIYSQHTDISGADNNTDNETVSVTSYGFHSHKMYGQIAPCAVLIIKPHALEKHKQIEALLESHDVMILSKRIAALHREAIEGFLKDNEEIQVLNPQVVNLIIGDMCNGNVAVYCLGDKTNQTFRQVQVGLERIHEISKIIMNKFGTDAIQNAVYVSRDIEEMRKQRKFFFLDSVFFKHESIDDSRQYSMMIIKPNAFKFRKKIIQLLKSKEFEVVVNKRMKSPMELSVAQEFFNPYFGSDAEFDEYCESMSSGEWAVIMVSRVGNCISALRQFTQQIQRMYATDDQSIADHAVYTCSCETDFWRDRSFFFFSNTAHTFMDAGSVRSFKRGRSRKQLVRKQDDMQTPGSVYSEISAFTNMTEPLSIAFALNPIEETVLLIKPHVTKHKREIEKILLDQGFYIAKSRPMNMPSMVWADFYRKYEHKSFYEDLCSAMAEDQIISYVLYRVNAISFLRKLVGPTDPNTAKQRSPKSLRAIYGESMIRNAFHCSHDADAVIKERSELFFEDTDTIWGNSTTDKHRNLDRVFVMIKPNSAKLYGDHIRTHLVANGFMIAKEKVVHLSEAVYMNLSLDITEEYFEKSIAYLATDQIIVMVVEKKNAYQDIMDVIGHRDPQFALQKQPDSIRAIYGKNIIQNAIEASFNEDIFSQNYEVFFDDDDMNFSDTKSYKRLEEQRKHQQQKINEFKQLNQKEKCLLIIKPHIEQPHIEYIKQMLIGLDFEIMAERHTNMPYHAFTDAFNNDEDPNTLDAICREWCSGEITIFVLSKLNAYSTIRTLVGPEDPDIARSEAPQSIRARFGQDRIRNSCWYSADQSQYNLKLQHFDY